MPALFWKWLAVWGTRRNDDPLKYFSYSQKVSERRAPCWLPGVALCWQFLLRSPHRLLRACMQVHHINISLSCGWSRLMGRLGVQDPADDALPGLIVFLCHWSLGAKSALLFISHDYSEREIMFYLQQILSEIWDVFRCRYQLLHTARSSGTFEDVHQLLKPKPLLVQLSVLASFAISFPFSPFSFHTSVS